MMRTKEQGLLTTADAFQVTGILMELYQRAHGGDLLASAACPGCEALPEAMGTWIGHHAASEEELDELERAGNNGHLYGCLAGKHKCRIPKHCTCGVLAGP